MWKFINVLTNTTAKITNEFNSIISSCKARELGLAGVRGTFSAILGVSIVIMLLSLTDSIGLMSQNITHNKNDKLMEVEYEVRI